MAAVVIKLGFSDKSPACCHWNGDRPGGIFSTKDPTAATTKSPRLESYSHSIGCKT